MKHPLILFCALGATSPVARAKSGVTALPVFLETTRIVFRVQAELEAANKRSNLNWKCFKIPLKQFPIILSHIGAACPQPQNPPKVDTPP